jgi:hypothetical protein
MAAFAINLAPRQGAAFLISDRTGRDSRQAEDAGAAARGTIRRLPPHRQMCLSCRCCTPAELMAWWSQRITGGVMDWSVAQEGRGPAS